MPRPSPLLDEPTRRRRGASTRTIWPYFVAAYLLYRAFTAFTRSVNFSPYTTELLYGGAYYGLTALWGMAGVVLLLLRRPIAYVVVVAFCTFSIIGYFSLLWWLLMGAGGQVLTPSSYGQAAATSGVIGATVGVLIGLGIAAYILNHMGQPERRADLNAPPQYYEYGILAGTVAGVFTWWLL